MKCIGYNDFPAVLGPGESCYARYDIIGYTIATRKLEDLSFKQEVFEDGNPNLKKWCEGEDVPGDDCFIDHGAMEDAIRGPVGMTEEVWAEQHEDQVWRMLRRDEIETLG